MISKDLEPQINMTDIFKNALFFIRKTKMEAV